MRILSDAAYSLKNEFNSHYYGVKAQFNGNTSLTNSLAGIGTSGVVSFVGSITGMVMAGVGLAGAGAAVASVAGLASLGIVIATFASAGRTTPAIAAGTYAGIVSPFTASAKGIKTFMARNTKNKNTQRIRPY